MNLFLHLNTDYQSGAKTGAFMNLNYTSFFPLYFLLNRFNYG